MPAAPTLTKTEFTPPDSTVERDDWLEDRRSGIGGSDLSAVLGLNPWRGGWDVWAEKVGEIKSGAPTERMHWGNLLEDVIAREWARRTGVGIRRARHIKRSATHPYMIASLDRVVIGKRESLEVKTTNAYALSDWLTKGVPVIYQIQVQHYLAVMDYEVCHLVALFGGQELRAWKIYRNDAAIAEMWGRAMTWWNTHVVAGVPPEMDGSRACSEYLKDEYPDSAKDMLVTDDKELNALMAKLVDAKAQEKEWKATKKAYENRIKARIGDRQGIITPTHKATWKTTSPRANLDTDLLKANWPDVYKAIAKEGKAGRRFTADPLSTPDQE